MTKEMSLRLVSEEIDRATAKFEPFASPHEGYAILLEEVDELWDEIKYSRVPSKGIRDESIQVAAMAIRMLMDQCDIERVPELGTWNDNLGAWEPCLDDN